MRRDLARLAKLGLVGAITFACSVDEIDLDGKLCPCAAGWVCDEPSGVCIKRTASSGGGAAGAGGSPVGGSGGTASGGVAGTGVTGGSGGSPVGGSGGTAGADPGKCATPLVAQVGVQNGSNAPSNSNVSNAITSYDCALGPHAGNEAAYVFVPTSTAKWKIKLNNLTANCDLFVVSPSCGDACFTPDAHSEQPDLTGEGVNVVLTAGQSYYLVIDSQPGVTCDFQLEILLQ